MIAAYKGKFPAALLLIPLMTGIGCALAFPDEDRSIALIPFVVLSIVFASLNFFYRPLNVYKYGWLGGVLILSILFTSGWYLIYQRNELHQPDHFSKQKAGELLVNITSEPKVKDDLVRFTAEVVAAVKNDKLHQTSGTILITIKDELANNLFYGEQLLIPAKYDKVEPPYNPGEFNYKQYLAHKNIYYQAYLYPKQYRVVDAGKGNPAISFALDIRQRLVNKLKSNMRDTTAIAVASTLILGYKTDLSNDVMQAYSKTGTIHILSVSGGHVAILLALLSFLLGFMNHPRTKVTRAIMIILVIWAYALLTGFSPAVNRAALMITLVIAGKTYSRHISNLNILAVSAFVLLLYDPYLLTDVGFQLSYLAVAGLVVFQPIIYQWFTFKNKAADKLWMVSSVSIAAQVATFPLSAYYFHQFPVYFLLSNLLIIIPVAVIMYSGLTFLLLPQIPFVSKTLGYILEKSILLMNKMLVVIEQAPYASFGKIWITKTEFILLNIIIGLVFYCIYKKSKGALFASLIGVLIFSCGISLKKFKADNTNLVTFLNLRKHQGIVFKHGSKGVVLTDLPQNDKNFQYAIQPCLDSLQITTYEVLPFSSTISINYLLKKDALVWFRNKKLLLLNDSSRFKSIPADMLIDKAYLSNNTAPDTTLANVPLIIDGTNSKVYIEHLKQDGKKYALLKRNKALVLLSN
ncbi:ComEC family competence protein [Mucilaginibacter conchicola]|uniref:ComEC family competence protein n=1 Tax=Mucilaginibacter conchicola TaxID=2303333 RepID=A0A372NWS4_9SPHI|nr:ComEC/Rec2 family competence protein [Mucilaginibacter conchicola]RFZ94566.1 ComEC family competence protein [Mucilaginibacter conchicola]